MQLQMDVIVLTWCLNCFIFKVKERLGGNLRIIVSGGAPLSVAVEEFLRVVTCAHVVQGYGIHLWC
jgi:long-chain acyl-CoA synthetase